MLFFFSTFLRPATQFLCLCLFHSPFFFSKVCFFSHLRLIQPPLFFLPVFVFPFLWWCHSFPLCTWFFREWRGKQHSDGTNKSSSLVFFFTAVLFPHLFEAASSKNSVFQSHCAPSFLLVGLLKTELPTNIYIFICIFSCTVGSAPTRAFSYISSSLKLLFIPFSCFFFFVSLLPSLLLFVLHHADGWDAHLKKLTSDEANRIFRLFHFLAQSVLLSFCFCFCFVFFLLHAQSCFAVSYSVLASVRRH